MRLKLAFTLLNLLLILACAPGAQAAVETGNTGEIQLLRQEIQAMQSEYEARIAELERRLDAAEQSTDEANARAGLAQDEARRASQNAAVQTVSESGSSGVAVAGDNSFNPAIGVIFTGSAWSYDQSPEGYAIPGFPLGGEAGLAPEGLALAETEIDISANVDDKFTAWLTVPLVIEDSETAIEIEEAWVETLSLPAGLSVRMGRFFSNIGYLNDKHAHSWDFADQALVYQAFLGSQYIDDGLQFRWQAPTDFYLELGAEILRGDRYPAGGAVNSGVGSYSLSLKTGGDVGISHSWLAGLSWLAADSEERASGGEDAALLFNGDSDLVIADFVWKWAPNGNSRQRNFKFQAEYMWRDEDGAYAVPDGRVLPWNNEQQGWYAQAVFQPFPRWRFGARFDHLSSDNPGPGFADTALQSTGNDPQRYSVVVDWSNSEFSRLRFQYNLDDAGADDDAQFALQYIHSIGAHGAHSF
jgi:hypothetical protein